MSTETPVQPIAKWKLVTLLLIILIAIGIKLYSMWWPKADVFIGDTKIHVLVAETMRHRYEGWSNKEDMGDYGGMLFVFSDYGQHTMVMRDMQFPIDIVWLDKGVIIDIAPNAEPEPGRSESSLTPYFGRAASDAILELPAGFTSKNKIKIGDTVTIER